MGAVGQYHRARQAIISRERGNGKPGHALTKKSVPANAEPTTQRLAPIATPNQLEPNILMIDR